MSPLPASPFDVLAAPVATSSDVPSEGGFSQASEEPDAETVYREALAQLRLHRNRWKSAEST
jgi:hypothetical protein